MKTITMTEEAFFKATRLYRDGRDKFEQLGFITPEYRGFARFYTEGDVQVVRTILSLLDGTVDLRTAHCIASRSPYAQAA